jgi:hypothetical protein
MQADSAILALNCSGIVLGTLPVRQEHIFCMCLEVVIMVRVPVSHDFFCLLSALYCWFLQGEPIKDTSPLAIAPCDVILNSAHLKPSSRAANFWATKP